MKWVPQEELYNHLPGSYLSRQSSQSDLVRFSWNSNHELIAEVLGQSVLKPDGSLIIHPLVGTKEGESVSKVLLRETLHTNEQTTTVIRAAGPLFYMFVDLFPS